MKIFKGLLIGTLIQFTSGQNVTVSCSNPVTPIHALFGLKINHWTWARTGT